MSRNNERIDPAQEAQEWLRANSDAVRELGEISIVSHDEQLRAAEENSRLGHNGETDQPEEL